MTGVTAVATVVGTLLVLISMAGAARALAKARGVEASISVLTTANEGLRQANADLETKRGQDRVEFRDQLHAQELDCSKAIAELRGQVQALTGHLAEKIVEAVRAELAK